MPLERSRHSHQARNVHALAKFVLDGRGGNAVRSVRAGTVDDSGFRDPEQRVINERHRHACRATALKPSPDDRLKWLVRIRRDLPKLGGVLAEEDQLLIQHTDRDDRIRIASSRGEV